MEALDRDRARRLLGLLPDSGSADSADSGSPGSPDAGSGAPSFGEARRAAVAHARLRTHILARSAQPGRDAAAHRAELAILDEAAALLGAPGGRVGQGAPGGRRAALVLLAGVAGVGLVLAARGAHRLVGSPTPEPSAARQETDAALAPARASLDLHITPAGATAVLVREGDTLQSLRVSAPGSLVDLEPGIWALRASHPECPGDDARVLPLEGGEERSVSLRACPETGWLVVRSNVGDDSLAIDGAPHGATGPEPRALQRGEHTLRVERAGHTPWQAAVEILPAETLSLRADLLAAAGPPRQVQASAPAAPPVPPAADRAAQPDPSPAARAGSAEAQAAAAARDSAPGRSAPSERWTRQVREFLLRYDADRSGVLDRDAEIAAVPCDEWLGIEGSHDRSGLALAFTGFYGFDGSQWNGEVLGVDAGLRQRAYERMRECGLR